MEFSIRLCEKKNRLLKGGLDRSSRDAIAPLERQDFEVNRR